MNLPDPAPFSPLTQEVGSPEDALALALAKISGHSAMTGRSMLNSHEGFTTLHFIAPWPVEKSGAQPAASSQQHNACRAARSPHGGESRSAASSGPPGPRMEGRAGAPQAAGRPQLRSMGPSFPNRPLTPSLHPLLPVCRCRPGVWLPAQEDPQ
jgi:hypothetical protein